MLQQPSIEAGELVRLEGLPFPPKARFIYFSHHNLRQRIMLAHSPKAQARGSVIISPGRAEFCEKYFETAIDFLNRGFTVLIVDHRGQGLSDRVLARSDQGSYIQDFNIYAKDLGLIISTFKEDLPRPHVLFAHSMGGVIGLLGLMNAEFDVDAAILSSPMVGVVGLEQPFVSSMIRLCSFLGAKKRPIPFRAQRNGLPQPFPNNKHTSDRERYAIWRSYFEAAPRLRLAGPTFGWISAAIRAMAYIRRQAKHFRVPSLVLNAGSDRIVVPSEVERFARDVQAEYAYFPEAQHEIYMERNEIRDRMFEQIDSFLKAQAI